MPVLLEDEVVVSVVVVVVVVLPVLPDVPVLPVVPAAPIDVPLPVEPVEPVEPEAVVLVSVLLPAVEDFAPLLVGVPVAPMGVFCVLRWPAPTAGSFGAVVGGLP
jgi:hypothetical protein